MPFLREYGRPENDQGDWFTVPQTDGEAEVRLRIRRIPFEVALKMESRYGREEVVTNRQGLRRPQRVHTSEEELAVLRDKAEWAWTGSENLTVQPMDDEAADQYSRLVGEPVLAGKITSLDNHLSAAVKRKVLVRDLNLVIWILRRAEELTQRYERREQRLLGN